MNRQLTRQEQVNDLLANLMTAASVDSIQELEVWLESNQFSFGSLSELGHLIQLTIDVGTRFASCSKRKYAYVKNAAITLRNQGW